MNSLGVPVRALQAWDSELITGEVVYLVLLMNFGSSYPVDLDNLKRGEVGFKIGISPTYKPSKAAVAAAFRSHSSNTYTSESVPVFCVHSAKLTSLLRCRGRFPSHLSFRSSRLPLHGQVPRSASHSTMQRQDRMGRCRTSLPRPWKVVFAS